MTLFWCNVVADTDNFSRYDRSGEEVRGAYGGIGPNGRVRGRHARGACPEAAVAPGVAAGQG
jgi:hypothetical protein